MKKEIPQTSDSLELLLDNAAPELAKLGGVSADMIYLGKLSEILDTIAKTHFTYKKVSQDTNNFDYQVFFDGKLFSTYGAPFEKMIVLIVEALETGYGAGGKFVLMEMLDTIKDRK